MEQVVTPEHPKGKLPCDERRPIHESGWDPLVADVFRIAVLSGKGGTGKTFVSVNLAATAQEAYADVNEGTGTENGVVPDSIRSIYADCDVEEPNGHLFLQPMECCCETVSVMVPNIDATLCAGCRKCVSFCKFHALAYVKGQVKLFQELCHGCNGCVLLCPTGAMAEGQRQIGQLESGISKDVTVCTGTLNVGEATGVPVIHALLKALGTMKTRTNMPSELEHLSGKPCIAVLDCPPGSGCPVLESVRHADFCILVAEPTSFGLHDLGMVTELVRVLGKPAGLVLNRCTDSAENMALLASKLDMPLLGVVPFEPALAHLLAEGGVASREEDVYRALFKGMWRRIREVTGR